MKSNADDKIVKGRLSFLTDYHTMAKAHLDEYPDIERYEGNGVIAMKHDMRKKCGTKHDLPKEFDQCDCLFGAVPWRNEYKGFHERASADRHGWTHKDFVYRLGEIIEMAKLPTVIFISEYSGRDLPPPNQDETVTVGGVPCQAKVYNFTIENLKGMDESEVLTEMAKRYNCVGDPFCGYGFSGRVFSYYGKRSVLSDFNGLCIGYIEEHSHKWATEEPK